MSIAINLIKPAINNTKNLLFPIKYKEWLKLGLVSLLSKKNSSINSIRGPSNLLDESLFDILMSNLATVLAATGVLSLFILAFQWISCIFTFVFVDSIITKKTLIKDYFNKHSKKGTSLFLWNMLLFVCLIVLLVVPSIPIIISVLRNVGDLSLSALGISLFFIILYAFYLGLMIMLFMFISAIMFNFTVIEMYIKNKMFWPSFIYSLNVVKENFIDVIIYFVMRVLLGFVTGIISLLLIVPLLLILLFICLILVLIGVLLVSLSKVLLIPLIILGIPVGFILLLLFIFSIAVILLPFSVFYVNYMYLFYTKARK